MKDKLKKFIEDNNIEYFENIEGRIIISVRFNKLNKYMSMLKDEDFEELYVLNEDIEYDAIVYKSFVDFDATKLCKYFGINPSEVFKESPRYYS